METDTRDNIGTHESSSNKWLNSLFLRQKTLLEQLEACRQGPNTQDHLAEELARASILEIQARSFALDQKHTRTLRRVEAAIERWKGGTYGSCMACEVPIEERRLNAVPETEFCIGCQKTLEGKRYGYSH